MLYTTINTRYEKKNCFFPSFFFFSFVQHMISGGKGSRVLEPLAAFFILYPLECGEVRLFRSWLYIIAASISKHVDLAEIRLSVGASFCLEMIIIDKKTRKKKTLRKQCAVLITSITPRTSSQSFTTFSPNECLEGGPQALLSSRDLAAIYK